MSIEQVKQGALQAIAKHEPGFRAIVGDVRAKLLADGVAADRAEAICQQLAARLNHEIETLRSRMVRLDQYIDPGL